MNTIELVVARYQEDLQWLRRVPGRFRVTVYNKGGDALNLPRRRALEVVATPTVGREERSYLRHIVRRYEDLADITVFAQGKPFDHVPDFHKQLHRIAFRQLAVDRFLWFGFIIDEDDAAGSLLFQRWRGNPDGAVLPLDRFWRQLWNESAPERVTFYPGAHFAVTADQVRTRPRSFYERAVRISAELPHAGHCFERTWDRIFGVDGVPLEYRDVLKPVYLRRIRRLAQP